MDIGQQLTLLAELAHVEHKWQQARDGVEALHAGAKRADVQLTEARSIAEKLGAAHLSLETQRRTMESSLAAERDKLRKWQVRADQIRGEREHAALASEIGAQKRSISHLENDILEKMQEVEDAEKALAAARAAMAEAEASARSEWARIDDDLRAAREVAATEERARGALVAKLPAPLIKRYEKIAEKRGVAIAVVHGELCSACKRTLPPQLCIQLYKGQVLETCPSCQRILVHEAMTRAPGTGDGERGAPSL
ncbi:MAG: zinc ribbon domain-containing protein [Myxococcota bacterium]